MSIRIISPVTSIIWVISADQHSFIYHCDEGTMKELYFIKLGIAACAQADLLLYCPKCWVISQIVVPTRYRNAGHGTDLLKKITDDADDEGCKLMLDVNSYGEMSHA